MRRFCLGDLHGNFRGFKQCLERCNFDYDNDLLISIGDVVDGHSQTYECIEEILKIKNRILIKGNHDHWMAHWLEYGVHEVAWSHGGQRTIESYLKHCLPFGFVEERGGLGGYRTNLNPGDIPETHKRLFDEQIAYYIDEDNNCFVHGGFDPRESIKKQPTYYLMWNRDLIKEAIQNKGVETVDGFKRIFLGHTATTNWGIDERIVNGIVIPGKKQITTPIVAGNVINIDTGAGFRYPLTIMNIDTDEYFQSDQDLYPDERHR